MAKISARGATEVAALEGTTRSGQYAYRYVMCSDGRVLKRATGEYQGSYSVRGTVRAPANRTREFLAKVIERDGLTVREVASARRTRASR